MAAFLFGAEPFEESQPGGSPRQSTASPDELNAFYEDMKRQETLQRHLSRGKSKSLWSRKSTKKANITPAMPQIVQKSPTPTAPPVSLSRSERGMQDAKEELKEKHDQFPPVLSRSIIPDPLGELPAWFNKENKDWVAAPLPAHRMKYQIHNPVGPPWYHNHHLIPLSQLKPSGPPPSFFPPAFPSTTHPSASDDTTRFPPGSPPGSSSHTPNASQTGIDGRPRSRKTSQTAQDNVDLLDVTDPWGTNWHHQSPYDPISTDEPEDASTRSRSVGTPSAQLGQVGQNSQNAPSGQNSQIRHKAATPSPLSQSTPAIHIQSAEPAPPSRKLSKSRTGAGNSSGGKEPDEPKVSTQTLSPVEFPSTEPPAPQLSNKLSERSSSLGPISNPSRLSVATHPAVPVHLKEKKEKRESVLGRIARKLSILRKPDYRRGVRGSRIDDWHHVNSSEVKAGAPRLSRQSSPEKGSRQSSEPLKKSSPSTGVQSSGAQGSSGSGAPRRDAGDRSSASFDLETPLSIGRLTIANPDAPSSVPNTPMMRSATLTSDVTPERVLSQAREEQRRSALPPTPVEPDASSLRPPTPPPRDSQSTIPSPPTLLTVGDSALMQTTVAPPVAPVAELVEPTLPPVSAPSEPSPAPSTPKTPHASTRVVTTVPRPPSPPVAPRPISDQTFEYAAAPALAFLASSGYIDDSPLSRASMVVNPPTPYTSPSLSVANRTPSPPMSTLANPPTPRISPEPTSPIVSSDLAQAKADKSSHRDTSSVKVASDAQAKDKRFKPPSSVASRQTETFRLVRNQSGDATSGQAIAAAGEQWEVVESTNVSRRNKTKGRERSSKSTEQESGSRREQRRQEKSRGDSDRSRDNNHSYQRSSHGRVSDQQAANSSVSTPSKGSRGRSLDVVPRPKISDTTSRSHDDSKKRSEDRERGPDRRGSDSAKSVTATVNINKPQPPAPPSDQHWQPTSSTRPTSELPSSAELNALRAREAWEMDRLYRGRSIHYGAEPNGVMSSPAPLVSSIRQSSSSNVELGRENGSVLSAGHGSSHTSFMQTSFQVQPHANMYYSQSAIPPPPIVYSSPASSSQSLQHPPPHQYANSYPSFANHPAVPMGPGGQTSQRTPLTNPLPEPPRESPYDPPPLPPVLTDTRSGHSVDYWTKYASVTTAH